MKFLIALATFIATGTMAVSASSAYSSQINDFLKKNVTLHYTEQESRELYNSAQSEYSSFSFIEGINFYDINGDSVPEIFVNKSQNSGSICEVYGAVEGQFEKIGYLDGYYKLFTNQNKIPSVLEGSNVGEIKYSRLYIDNDKLLKDTVYNDGRAFNNRINGRNLGTSVLEDITLLDSTAYPINKMNFDTNLASARSEVRSALRLGTTTPHVHIIINNLNLPSDTNPIILDNRLLVPIRAISENLGAEVLWEGATRQATVVSGTTTIRFTLDSQVAYINNVAVTLDTKPVVRDNRSLLPMRFVAENIGAHVAWSANTRTVFIQDEGAIANRADIDGALVFTEDNSQIKTQFQNITPVTVSSGQYSEVSLFWSNEPFTNLKIHELSYDGNSDTFTSTNIVRELASLTPNDLLSVQSNVPETIPSTGITYTDHLGVQRSYAIVYNGRFGGIGLSRITIR
ncbi:MAG: copper amine oxidase N-terminal domain-containing protein [Clostridiales bacterium]|nr:copper amine oxidase N-terminal domain-containing protein [Clostridiales bacterium]